MDFGSYAGYGIPYQVVSASTPRSVVTFEYDEESDHGGIAAAVIIAGITVSPNSLLSKLLAIGLLAWLGRISYGVYLWHYPVLFLSPALAQGHQIAFTGITSILLAATTYYYVELPAIRAGKNLLARRLGERYRANLV